MGTKACGPRLLFYCLVVTVPLIWAPCFTNQHLPKIAWACLLLTMLVATQPLRWPEGAECCWALLWLWSALTLCWSPVPLASAHWLVYGFLLLLLHSMARHYSLPGLAPLILVPALVVAVYGLWQSYTLPRLHNYPTNVATLGNVNHAAAWLIIIIPVLGALVLSRSSSGPLRAGALLTLVLVISYLALTGCRGAWLGLGGGVLGGWFLWRPRGVTPRRRYYWCLGLLLVCLLPLTIPRIRHSVTQRLATLTDAHLPANRFRVMTWWATARMIADHPEGVGAGAFAYCFVPYRLPEEYLNSQGRLVTHPHNEYLSVLAQLGWPGLLLFLLWLALLLRRVYQRCQQAPDQTRALWVGVGMGLLAVMLHALFSNPWQAPASGLYFVLLANLGMKLRARSAQGVTETQTGDQEGARLGRLKVNLTKPSVTETQAGDQEGSRADRCNPDAARKTKGQTTSPEQLGKWERILRNCLRAVYWQAPAAAGKTARSTSWRSGIGRPGRFGLSIVLGVLTLLTMGRLYGDFNLQQGRTILARQVLQADSWARKGCPAVPYFQRAVAYQPYSHLAYQELGRAYLAGRNYEQAILALQQAVALFPGSPTSLVDLGLAQLAAGQLRQARLTWQQGLRRYPLAAVLHYNLGKLLYDTKQPGALVQLVWAAHLNPGLWQKPNFALLYGSAAYREGAVLPAAVALRIGTAALQARQARLARHAFEDLRRSDPQSLEAHDGLARSYELAGDYQAALLLYARALKLHPVAPQLHLGLGGLLLRLRSWAAAHRHLIAVLSRGNAAQCYQACFHLGELFYAQRQLDRALHFFQRARKLRPRAYAACQNAGVILFEQQRFSKAQAVFGQAARLAPTAWQPHLFLARIAALQHQPQQALTQLGRAIEQGFRNYRLLERDPSLQTLRRHPLYCNFIKRLSKDQTDGRR